MSVNAHTIQEYPNAYTVMESIRSAIKIYIYIYKRVRHRTLKGRPIIYKCVLFTHMRESLQLAEINMPALAVKNSNVLYKYR